MEIPSNTYYPTGRKPVKEEVIARMESHFKLNIDEVVNLINNSQPTQVVISLGIFSIPALLAELRRFFEYPRWLLSISSLLIPLGIYLYWRWTSTDNSERTADAIHRPGNVTGSTPPLDVDDLENTVDGKISLISITYRMLNRQAEYRDRLLMRASYFSLAVIAALVNIFLRSSGANQVLVAMVGTATGFGFLLGMISYKGTRDELNNKIRELENHQPIADYLSVVEVYDQRDRHPIAKRSLSSYLVGLQAGTAIGWCVLYIIFILLL